MAYLAQATKSNYISGNLFANALGSQQCTIACFTNRVSGTDQEIGPLDRSAANWNGISISFSATNEQYGQILYTAYVDSLINASTNWLLLSTVFNGALTGNTNRLKIYRNSTNVTYQGYGTVSANIGSTAVEWTMKNSTYAETAIWNVALTDAEIASLAKGFSPRRIRPQSLVFYAPLIRNVQDLRQGLALTAVNAPTVANHPRVY